MPQFVPSEFSFIQVFLSSGSEGPTNPLKIWKKAFLSESFYSLCWKWGLRWQGCRIWVGSKCVSQPPTLCGHFLWMVVSGRWSSNLQLNPPSDRAHFLMLLLHWELRTALLILPWNLPPFHFYPLIVLPMKTHFKTQTPCHLLSLPCKLLYLQWFLFFFNLKKNLAALSSSWHKALCCGMWSVSSCMLLLWWF